VAEFRTMVSSGLPCGQRQADAAVARQVAGAGQDQVAHAGQAHEGFGLAAQRRAQAGDFGQAARDQGGARIQAQAQAVGGAGGDGQDVLHGAADFHADQVVAGIHAHAAAVHQPPPRARAARPSGRHRQRAGQAARHFLGERGAGQGRARHALAQHFAHHLVRQQAGAVFETLAQPDDVRDRPPLSCSSSGRRPATGQAAISSGVVRRRRDMGEAASKSALTRRPAAADGRAGSRCFRAPRGGGHLLGIAAPQQHVVAGGQRDRDRGAPGAGAEDGDGLCLISWLRAWDAPGSDAPDFGTLT
jgi:hypothetical protein